MKEETKPRQRETERRFLVTDNPARPRVSGHDDGVSPEVCRADVLAEINLPREEIYPRGGERRNREGRREKERLKNSADLERTGE